MTTTKVSSLFLLPFLVVLLPDLTPLYPLHVPKFDPRLWYIYRLNNLINSPMFLGWNSSGIDVLLCPVAPGAAPPHDCSRYWGYTSVWNLLDYPALVFPVSRVDLNVDRRWDEDGDYVSPKFENEMERYNIELCKYCAWERRV